MQGEVKNLREAEDLMFKSGFIALIGRPNVGKSTLMNKLVGEKMAIISDKPQTTRNRIAGILNLEGAQVIFLDTPGIHRPRHKLGEYMVKVSRGTLAEVDLIFFLVEASSSPGPGDQFINEILREVGTPVFLIINKSDLVSKKGLAGVRDSYRGLGDFARVLCLSALRGDNLGELLEGLLEYLPEGPRYYPEDMITDQPERFIVGELIREKILELTREEIPHSVAVEIQEMKEREGQDLVYLSAVIYVERDSQKGILVGKGGGLLKEVGKRARQDMERLLGSRVYLELWVKVKKDWRNREKALHNLGYTAR